jgi:hypothetical protein
MIWREKFTGITWSGGAWGSGDLEANDASPEEILLWMTWTRLREEPTLADLFTPKGSSSPERIEATEFRNLVEFANLPRLQIYLASTTEEQRPTRLDLTEIRVLIGLRFDLSQALERLQPAGVSTFASVVRLIKTTLKGDHHMTVSINGTQTPLAPGGSHQEGAVSYLVDLDEEGGRHTLTAEIEWVYKTNIDFDTGRIANIVRAGGYP